MRSGRWVCWHCETVGSGSHRDGFLFITALRQFGELRTHGGVQSVERELFKVHSVDQSLPIPEYLELSMSCGQKTRFNHGTDGGASRNAAFETFYTSVRKEAVLRASEGAKRGVAVVPTDLPGVLWRLPEAGPDLCGFACDSAQQVRLAVF